MLMSNCSVFHYFVAKLAVLEQKIEWQIPQQVFDPQMDQRISWFIFESVFKIPLHRSVHILMSCVLNLQRPNN